MLTILSLYVSSLSTSGVKAMATSLPVVLVASVLGQSLHLMVGSTLYAALRYGRTDQVAQERLVAYHHTLEGLFIGMVVVLAALLLAFGYANHRSVERGFRRIAPQMITIAAYVVVCLIVIVLLTDPATVARYR